jgi:hypothetical protein
MSPSKSILLLPILIVCISAAVTINTLTGVSAQNLVYSGLIPVDTNSLFFTYFGVDGQTDQNSLKDYPLLVVVGK